MSDYVFGVEVEQDVPRGYSPHRWLTLNGKRVTERHIEGVEELAAELNAAVRAPPSATAATCARGCDGYDRAGLPCEYPDCAPASVATASVPVLPIDAAAERRIEGLLATARGATCNSPGDMLVNTKPIRCGLPRGHAGDHTLLVVGGHYRWPPGGASVYVTGDPPASVGTARGEAETPSAEPCATCAGDGWSGSVSGSGRDVPCLDCDGSGRRAKT